MRRRAEEAFVSGRKPAADICQFFASQPPVTQTGRIALAIAFQAEGRIEEAANLIRHVWREDTFGGDVEDKILERFPDVLTQADHRFRMERLLLKENWGGATRAAEFAGKDYDTLVKARLGVYQGTKKAEKAFAAVPASLRSDPSYLFSRALYLRRNGKIEDAARIMAQAPQDPELLVDGDEWWAERRYVARKLLDNGKDQAAYEVASRHGAESPAQRIEAEFHAGWIALRFLHDAEGSRRAFRPGGHECAATPISIARAAYWQGRAAEAAGETDAAEAVLRAGRRQADRPITASSRCTKLGRAHRPARVPIPSRTRPGEAFEALPSVQARQPPPDDRRARPRAGALYRPRADLDGSGAARCARGLGRGAAERPRRARRRQDGGAAGLAPRPARLSGWSASRTSSRSATTSRPPWSTPSPGRRAPSTRRPCRAPARAA